MEIIRIPIIYWEDNWCTSPRAAWQRQREKTLQILDRIFSATLFLALQGISLRGHRFESHEDSMLLNAWDFVDGEAVPRDAEDLLVFLQKHNLLAQFESIATLLKLALTLSVSSAHDERAFSYLKRVKTYLRSTMTENFCRKFSTLAPPLSKFLATPLHRWTYFLRTLPDIQDLLQPLENAIAKVFLPAITEHECTQLEREILALPVRKCDLGVTNPSQEAAVEYAASRKITAPLVEQIQSQRHELYTWWFQNTITETNSTEGKKWCHKPKKLKSSI